MTTQQSAAYIVQQMAYDAARPFAVVATFRSFNRVIARYATKLQAARRAHVLNRDAACQGFKRI